MLNSLLKRTRRAVVNVHVT